MHEEEPSEGALVPKKKLRFVQLYTSKSFESRRSQLVNPPVDDGPSSDTRKSNSSENLQEHVLSPRLVDAISKTAQVVWANTKKQEGLTGRSDIRLQTAVGMPVATDAAGNMCIVVMFSPNNIQSTDDAMEYLNSITHSATSSAIPCLLPVFDPDVTGMRRVPRLENGTHRPLVPHPDPSSLGEGVTARFVSFDDTQYQDTASDEPEIQAQHELATAPKDTFGIPMLPLFAELGNNDPGESGDIFDEASYGIWNTIMETFKSGDGDMFDFQNDFPGENSDTSGGTVAEELQVTFDTKPPMSRARQERLEEFCEAFLDMSVFDLADVWIPAGGDYADSLRHVTSRASSSSRANESLHEFARLSENTIIKFWTGAVGRAYSSGNPVWSANANVFVDPGRFSGFEKAKIQTVLAIPIFSGKNVMPTCVVACYSLVKSGSVPFVLRFVQQALRLLWDGLDKIEPHYSVDKNIWKDVAPADLGEMAADVEMQHHFVSKKRTHNSMSRTTSSIPDEEDTETTDLALQFHSIDLPNGETISVPLQLSENTSQTRYPGIKVETLQSHFYDAVKSVQNAKLFVDHVNTNDSGTKRAHVMHQSSSINIGPAPLPVPQPLPTQVFGAQQSSLSTAPHGTADVKASLNTAFQTQNYVSTDTWGMTYLNGGSNVPSASYRDSQTSYNGEPNQFVATSNEFGMPMMVHTSLTPCRIQGCDEVAVARRPYCQKHSGNRLCEHEDCNKCAQGSTRFCIAHGGGRRCTHPGCDKGARDKLFCAAHGGGKRCRLKECTKSAVGGSAYCTAHGGGRRCSVEGCDKSAQSSTKFCVKHGGGKKCGFEGCEKVARGRTNFCAAHGGGVRCKLEDCNRVAIGKLQLCRAHGGGSTRARKNGQGPEEPTPL